MGRGLLVRRGLGALGALALSWAGAAVAADAEIPPVPDHAERMVVCSSSSLLRDLGLLVDPVEDVSPSQPLSVLLDGDGKVVWARWSLPGKVTRVGVGDWPSAGTAPLADKVQPREGCWFWSRAPAVAALFVPEASATDAWLSTEAVAALELADEAVTRIGPASVASVPLTTLVAADLAGGEGHRVSLKQTAVAPADDATGQAAVGGLLNGMEAVITKQTKLPRGSAAGTCEVVVVINADGSPRIVAFSGPECPADYEAVGAPAVAKWRFKPKDGSEASGRWAAKITITVKGP